MVFYLFVTKCTWKSGINFSLSNLRLSWCNYYLTWVIFLKMHIDLNWNWNKNPQVKNSGSYWSVPVWLSALFVKPHAKSVFNKLALNTDFSSSSSSKLFLWGKWFCCSLQWRNSCTSASWTFRDSSTKTDKCIHETGFAVTLASCAIIYPVTDHPSHFLQKTEQGTSLPGFQGGNRAPRNTSDLIFSLCESKRCSHSLGNTVGNLKELSILS